jgi:hypothetical protein
MAAFRAGTEFGEDGVMNTVLCVDEPPQIERVCAIG